VTSCADGPRRATDEPGRYCRRCTAPSGSAPGGDSPSRRRCSPASASRSSAARAPRSRPAAGLQGGGHVHLQEAAVPVHPRLLVVDEQGLHGPGHPLGERGDRGQHWRSTRTTGSSSRNFILGLMRFGHDPSPNSGSTPRSPATPPAWSTARSSTSASTTPTSPASPTSSASRATTSRPPSTPSTPARRQPHRHRVVDPRRPPASRAYFDITLADHPADGDQRLRSILLITDGPWTNQQGTSS
jgi:hypothetical protein